MWCSGTRDGQLRVSGPSVLGALEAQLVLLDVFSNNTRWASPRARGAWGMGQSNQLDVLPRHCRSLCDIMRLSLLGDLVTTDVFMQFDGSLMERMLYM